MPANTVWAEFMNFSFQRFIFRFFRYLILIATSTEFGCVYEQMITAGDARKVNKIDASQCFLLSVNPKSTPYP
jgi:hypothetical protein